MGGGGVGGGGGDVSLRHVPECQPVLIVVDVSVSMARRSRANRGRATVSKMRFCVDVAARSRSRWCAAPCHPESSVRTACVLGRVQPARTIRGVAARGLATAGRRHGLLAPLARPNATTGRGGSPAAVLAERTARAWVGRRPLRL